MAVFSGTRYSDSDAQEIRPDVSSILAMISPSDVPMLNLIGLDSLQTPCTATKHEWNERSLRALDSALAATIASTGATTCTVTTGDGKLFAAGDIIKIESELMLVTGVATDTLTIVRGNGGSTAATHASGLAVSIVGAANVEDNGTVAARTSLSTRVFNYCQIYLDAVKVTSTDQAVAKYTTGNDRADRLAESMKTALMVYERQLIHGRKVAPVGGTTGGQMGGLLQFITSNVYAKSGALLDFDDIKTAVRDAWTAGGKIDTIVCNSFQKERINSFLDSRRQTDQANRTVGDRVDVVDTDYGIAQVVLDRNLPKDTVLLLEKGRIGFGPLRGGGEDFSVHAVMLPRTNPLVEEWRVLGQYTAEVRNQEAHAAITGLATS